MNTAFVAGIVATFAASASAQTVTKIFDVSDLHSEGDFFENFPTLVHDFGAAGEITEISWNLNWESFAPSWLSEVFFSVDTDLGFFVDLSSSNGTAPDSPGTYSHSDAISFTGFESGGEVFLTLWDDFDDTSVSPDAIYGDGSTITVSYLVPTPGVAAALGLGGMAGLRRTRRS